MEKYDIVKFNKNDIIIKSGENPSEYFYILIKGNALSHYSFYKKFKYKYKKGSIMGLISSITGEPYFSTIEADEDSEALKIKIKSIMDMENEELLNKIYEYLHFVLETWLSKYYTMLAVNKVDLYNKEDIITMANIYKNNGFIDACNKLCLKYIELFPENNDIEEVKEFIKDIKFDKNIEHIDNSILKLPKGHCIYTEIHSADNIYLIESGKIGAYSVINSNIIIRNIYTNGYIINGYNPRLEYKPLLTTAIVLEDSIIKVITKEQLIEMISRDKSLKINYLKMLSLKINNVIFKIKAIEEDKLQSKLIIIIYSMLKMYSLFNEDTDKLTLAYTIEDIKNILNINLQNDEISEELKNIKYVKFDNALNITITNIKNYLKEYKDYIR
ncbi:cyclic nucleotide-binding domain-containing protein [uncultured Brachyspira sp.]|uniref:cyclic nucleotide-binding domain-containing protein n=1 Tax=uncultured Brachyspira sp. TaxID=221953 RepID=UPI0025F11957|nr:cyclic nucleotide-binding domain-containing protein [uncultured Brachyspira sp.]